MQVILKVRIDCLKMTHDPCRQSPASNPTFDILIVNADTSPTSQAASTGSRCNPRDRKQKDGTIKKRQWNEERAPIMLRTLNQLRDRRECISHKACLCQPFPTAHALPGLCRPSKLSSGMLIADWQQVLSLSGIFKLNGGPAQTYIIC